MEQQHGTRAGELGGIAGFDPDDAMLVLPLPALRADEMNVPVLLMHGKNDRVVFPEQSERMHEALEGRRDVKMPADWPSAYAKLSQSSNKQVRDKSLQLALVFGDERATDQLRRVLLDAKQPLEARRSALRTDWDWSQSTLKVRGDAVAIAGTAIVAASRNRSVCEMIVRMS